MVHLFQDPLSSAVLTIVDIIRRVQVRTEAAITVRRLEINIEALYEGYVSIIIQIHALTLYHL